MNDIPFTYSVEQIRQTYITKENKKLSTYNAILSLCYKKIKLSADNDLEMCIYVLPEYISGHPLYNKPDCITYMITHLHENGYNTEVYNPTYDDSSYKIVVTWILPKTKLTKTNPLFFVPKINDNIYSVQTNNSLIPYKPIQQYGFSETARTQSPYPQQPQQYQQQPQQYQQPQQSQQYGFSETTRTQSPYQQQPQLLTNNTEKDIYLKKKDNTKSEVEILPQYNIYTTKQYPQKSKFLY